MTVRCPFCLTLNQVDLARAASRPRCGKCSRPILLDRPVKVSAEDFDRTVVEADAPVLVDFYADWCGPCKMIAPMVDRIAHEHTGRLLVAKVDTDMAPQIAARFGIRGVPTLIFFRGGEEIGRSTGIEPERIQDLLQQALA